MTRDFQASSTKYNIIDESIPENLTPVRNARLCSTGKTSSKLTLRMCMKMFWIAAHARPNSVAIKIFKDIGMKGLMLKENQSTGVMNVRKYSVLQDSLVTM